MTTHEIELKKLMLASLDGDAAWALEALPGELLSAAEQAGAQSAGVGTHLHVQVFVEPATGLDIDLNRLDPRHGRRRCHPEPRSPAAADHRFATAAVRPGRLIRGEERPSRSMRTALQGATSTVNAVSFASALSSGRRQSRLPRAAT